MPVSCYARDLKVMKLLRYTGDWEAKLPDRVAVDHGHSVGLEVHVLRHADVVERIPGFERQCERPEEGIAARNSMRSPDHVIGRGLEMMGVDPANPPGTVRTRFVADVEILLEAELALDDAAPGFRANTVGGRAIAIFQYAPGASVTREELHEIKPRPLLSKGGGRQWRSRRNPSQCEEA